MLRKVSQMMSWTASTTMNWLLLNCQSSTDVFCNNKYLIAIMPIAYGDSLQCGCDKMHKEGDVQLGSVLWDSC
jgi:hypothetical protein